MRKGLAGLLAAGGLTVGALSGCTNQNSVNDSFQRGMRMGYQIGRESGLEAGRIEQYEAMKSHVNGPLFVRNSETKDIVYGRIDLLFEGTSYKDYIAGRTSPSSMIIMSDLRGIEEPKEPLQRIGGNAYRDLLIRGQVPTIVISSPEEKARYDKDEGFQRMLSRVLPDHSTYTFKIVPKDQFQSVDPWSYIKDDLALESRRKRAIYHPARVVYPETAIMEALTEDEEIKIPKE